MPGNNSQQASSGGLPKFIRCSICGKEKDAYKHYSTKSINDYKAFHKKVHPVSKSQKNKTKDPGSLFIRCRVCTGGQPEEMTCRICRKTRAMTWFARAQRNDPDNATCRECMQAIQLVMPASSTVGAHDLDNEVAAKGRRGNAKDPYWKTDSGEYWTGHDGDASSVSNPWSSRAGSEYGSRGPISSRESISEYDDDDVGDDDESTISKSTTTASANNGRQAAGLTSENMAMLDKQLKALNVDNGMPIKSLLRRPPGIDSNIDSDNGSGTDDSDATIRKDGGAALVTAEPSYAASVFQPAKAPQYDDSDGEDDYDIPQFLQPIPPKDTMSLYDGNDHDGEADNHLTSTIADDENEDGTSVTSSSQAGYSSHLSGTQVFGSSMAYGSETYSHHSSSSVVNDWKGKSHVTKMVASGFKDAAYKKAADANNPRKFARVRPSNMRTEDMDKSLLHKDYRVPEYTGRKNDRGDVGSDEE